jgi:hypothetical protein
MAKNKSRIGAAKMEFMELTGKICMKEAMIFLIVIIDHF